MMEYDQELGLVSKLENLNSISPGHEDFLKLIEAFSHALKNLTKFSNGTHRFRAYRFHRQDFDASYENHSFFNEDGYCLMSRFDQTEHCWVILDREKIQKKLFRDTLFGFSNFIELRKNGVKSLLNVRGELLEEACTGLVKLLASEGLKYICRLGDLEHNLNKQDPAQRRLFIRELKAMVEYIEASNIAENLNLKLFLSFTLILVVAALFFTTGVVGWIALATVSMGTLWLIISASIDFFTAKPQQTSTISQVGLSQAELQPNLSENATKDALSSTPSSFFLVNTEQRNAAANEASGKQALQKSRSMP